MFKSIMKALAADQESRRSRMDRSILAVRRSPHRRAVRATQLNFGYGADISECGGARLQSARDREWLEIHRGGPRQDLPREYYDVERSR